jgi:hypothetical protein
MSWKRRLIEIAIAGGLTAGVSGCPMNTFPDPCAEHPPIGTCCGECPADMAASGEPDLRVLPSVDMGKDDGGR